jgi:hypothetical protein
METTETTKGAKKTTTSKGAKALKGKGKKGAKKAKSTRKDKPTTGQSAPHTDVKLDELNDKELKVLGAVNGKGEGSREEIAIPDLTKVFKNTAATKAQANSWVRNSLRRLVTGEYVEKLQRGLYRMTEKGRKRLSRASA